MGGKPTEGERWERCAGAALLCVLCGLAIQAAAVHWRFGGNWTALFCTGSEMPTPPALASEHIYVFPGSAGYDGQTYHYVAHDPLMRSDSSRFMDSPRLRYRRILLPATAWLAAGGRQSLIDAGYIGANLMFLFLGAWWLGRCLELLGIHPGWASLYFLTPAALVALDRLTVDLAFMSLCLGFALQVQTGRAVRAYALLVLACLCRETGFLLAGAACLAVAMELRFAKAAAWATAVAPAAAWYWYVGSRTPDYTGHLEQLIPGKGIVEALLHPRVYPFSAAANAGLEWLDRMAVLGIVLAMALSAWLIRRNGFGPLELAMGAWSIVGLCLPSPLWVDSYGGARVFAPLLLYVLLRAAPALGWKAMTPLLLVVPRVALQVAAPLVRALAG